VTTDTTEKARGEARNEKVLVIGCVGLAGVTSVGWMALRNVHNIADYPTVMISCGSLTDLMGKLRLIVGSSDDAESEPAESAARALSKDLRYLRGKLRQVLRAGGRVYAIVHPYDSLRPRERSGYGPLIETDEWAPLPINAAEEPGEGYVLKADGFARYFALVRRWSHVFRTRYTKDQLDPLVEDELPAPGSCRLVYQVLATDWQSNPIGMLLAFSFYGASHQIGVEPEPYFTSGPFVVLQPPSETSEEEAIRVLLQEACGFALGTAPPAWAASVSMPGDAARRQAVAEGQTRLAEAEKAYEAAVRESEQAEAFKDLLFEKGLRLQELVQRTFETMGVHTGPSEVSDEFMLTDGEKVLVEVKGHGKKGISGRDLSQLMKDLANHLAEVGEDVKGLLVGNAWAELPPEQRDIGDKDTFPANVIRTAKNRNVALLSTAELFKTYCAYLESKVDAETILRRIRDAAGPVALTE
jgi:hypothetical protein